MDQKAYLTAIRSVLVGMGVGLSILVMGALFATRLADPATFLTVIAYVALVLGAVICGILQGQSESSVGGILLASATYATLLLTVSLILGGMNRFFLKVIIYLGMGMISGITAWLIPAPRRRRRYRYK